MNAKTVLRPTSARLETFDLSPTEAFVLTRIDGASALADVADLTGVPISKVITIARRLVQLGALLAPGAVEMEPPPVRTVRTSKAPAAPRTQRPRTVRPPTKAPPAPPPAVDAETAAKIEAALRAMDGSTLHAVLGVAEGATAKEIRRAYFERAATLHPDRYFGKELGPYGRRLDAAFKRLTDAYETLRRDAPRSRPTVATAKIPTKLPPKNPSIRPSKRASKLPSKRPSLRPSKAPKKPSSAKLPASSQTAASIAAISKAAQFLMDAQKALTEGNAAGAVNLFRLALQITVDPNTRAIAETGLEDARAVMADSYAKSARAAEKKSQWSAAVEAYGKAVQHRPNDADLCERLANALREVGHDLTRAAAMAESAVARAPRRAAFRRTLGRIHAAAGQRALALEQLEAAASLEPDDETRSLIAKLRKRG